MLHENNGRIQTLEGEPVVSRWLHVRWKIAATFFNGWTVLLKMFWVGSAHQAVATIKMCRWKEHPAGAGQWLS